MTDQKTELEELKALQAQSRKLQRKRATPVPEDADPPKKKRAKKVVQKPKVDEIPVAPDDQDDTDDGLTGQVETIMSELEEAAQEHPSLALLAAFGIGVFVGQLLSRR